MSSLIYLSVGMFAGGFVGFITAGLFSGRASSQPHTEASLEWHMQRALERDLFPEKAE